MTKPKFKMQRKGHKGGGKFGNKKAKFSKNKVPPEIGARLTVRNLSHKTTVDALKTHFGVYGKTVFVKLMKNAKSEFGGCGIVQFENKVDASRARAATNGQSFLGRAIEVDTAIPRRDPDRNDESEAVQIKDEKTDEPEIQNRIKNETGAFSKPKNSNEDRSEKRQRKFHAEDGEEKAESVSKPKVKRKARLIVRNVSFKANEDSLKKHFESYGEILESTLLKKSDGRLIGCGFIQFADVKSATKAILELNAKPFLGRPIHVDWAVAKNKYMSHVIQKRDERQFLENDVKIESEDEDEKVEVKIEPDAKPKIKKESDDSDSDAEDDSDREETDESDEDGNEVNIKEEKPDLRVSANDAEDGRTIFLKNVAFSVTNEELSSYAQKFGEINYAIVCMDKLTEHSKGTAFIRFKTKEDADIFLSSPPEKLTLSNQQVQPMPAMFRERLNNNGNKAKKQPKDSRNLYLVKEGVILANSKASTGVSASDMAKRLTLEQSKSQMLRNLNRFISKYRLTIHNVPQHYSDEDLKELCLKMSGVRPFCLTECRIMKHLKGPPGPDGKYMSKGFAFVTFTKHEDALACLRRLNNNPSVFGTNNRPIVSFSIEDRAAINARNKRLEKSKIKNPLNKGYIPPETEGTNKDSIQDKKKPWKKRKNENMNESKNKKFKSDNTPIHGQSKKSSMNNDNQDFAGEVSKPGSVKFRSKFALREQAALHKETLKQNKRKMKQKRMSQKMGETERIRQPPLKKNAGKKTKIKQKKLDKSEKSFTDLVNKYKSKLIGDQQVKSKWYEGN